MLPARQSTTEAERMVPLNLKQRFSTGNLISSDAPKPSITAFTKQATSFD